jgi:molybdate/tungstate transport system substrate-binding protein
MLTFMRRFVAGAAGMLLFALIVWSKGTHAAACADDVPRLIIYHAGSLNAAFTSVEKVFTERTGICVVDVASGSVDAARRVTTGREPCDIYASADYEDIDLLLKPTHADYSILFAEGGMVLAYTTTSKNASTIAAPGLAFQPPVAIPEAASDWYLQLTGPGVTIGGSHPFLDPSGYRADMMFQLAQDRYRLSNLYNTFLTHYSINKRSDVLGTTYDYQFTYEHSAIAAFKSDKTNTYRYVRLPDDINLSVTASNPHYRSRGTTIPGLQVSTAAPTVRIPATRVTWGLTVLKSAPNPDNALRFLQLLFSREGVEMQAAVGPTPISPPAVSRDDFALLPTSLNSLVRVQSTTR